MKLSVLAWLVVLVPFAVSAELREGIHNGGFELGRDRMVDRPADWNIGFPGDAPPSGSWALRPDPAGGSALELHSDTEEGYFVSQIVDLPAATMAGTEVLLSVSVDTPSAPAWVAVQLSALNPESPIDPTLGFSHVGHLLLTTAASGHQGLAGVVTLTGPAEFLVVMLTVVGDNAVAIFDDVSVGIETDFFLLAHPDQWSAFRAMLCAARDRLRSVNPEIHVTTYFTLETLIHPDLNPNIDGQSAFRELAPFFQDAFRSIGARHLDGASKEAWRMLRHIR